MEKITLSGMPEPMPQPLYARAKESQIHGAIHDDTAVRVVQQLDYNFDFSSKDAAMHNGVIARAGAGQTGFYLPGAAPRRSGQHYLQSISLLLTYFL